MEQVLLMCVLIICAFLIISAIVECGLRGDGGVVFYDNAASPDNRTEVSFNWMKISTFA